MRANRARSSSATRAGTSWTSQTDSGPITVTLPALGVEIKLASPVAAFL